MSESRLGPGGAVQDTVRWSHETTLTAEPAAASRARAFVSRHLTEHRLGFLLDPVRLAASELATGALMHAQTKFTITLSGLDDVVLLSVRDASPQAAEARPAAFGIADRGRRIVSLVSLDWGVRVEASGVNTVWASFPRQRQRR
jgi:hypothetical protein